MNRQTMQIFHFSADLKKRLKNLSVTGNSIGFVPTMGALHKGHLSLVDKAKSTSSVVVVSIFVNPTQFNDPSDFEKYPSNISRDISLLIQSGCDILFYPSMPEIYPHGTKQMQHFNLGHLEQILEGKYRPGHFQGVCQVVERLLAIVEPDQLFLGEKDYQQCLVISKLLELTGLKDNVSLFIGSTIRESDGLAMSSRNTRLSKEEREMATVIYQSLIELKNNFHHHTLTELKEKSIASLQQAGFSIDYVEIADAESLNPIYEKCHQKELRALIAAKIGSVRLIDNIQIFNR